MFKKIIFISSLLLLPPVVLAQSKDQAAPYTLPPPVPIQVTSPDQFSDQVTAITAQKHAAFQQQLKQSIAQIPPPNYRAMGQKTPTPDNTQNQNPQQSSSTSTTSSSNPEEITGAQGNPPPPIQSSTAVNSSVTPPPPRQQQAQPYTGFQPPSTNMPAGSQPKAGGGWNIKY